MKIIIDLHEITLDHIKNYVEESIDIDNVLDQIRESEPLPKSIGRLIDAEVFIQELCKFEKVNTATVARALVETPTIIGG